MKIKTVSSVAYRQPIDFGGRTFKFAGEPRDSFETLLVRVETDNGLVGWGEAFPHRVWPAVKVLIDGLIGPACVGADTSDIAGTMAMLAYRYHGIGRAGPVMYALSGIDTALWDIAGKAAGKPIYQLLGGAKIEKIPAYASLLRYGETSTVVSVVEEALSRGAGHVKIHETGREEITAVAGLLAMHKAGPLMVDVNAHWSVPEALEAVAPLRSLGLKWVEEPVWPPEDFAGARKVQDSGIGVAIGENVQTPSDFARLIDGRFVDYVQPSVAKIGGVSVARDIFNMANKAAVAVAPHSAYFGPGLIATAHVIAALSPKPMVERLYCDLADGPFGDWYLPRDGYVAVPQGPGLGIEPDLKILEKLRVN
jgi:L-alanine-DL-glutamate epimerase-like enolase superfamily enzyme